jgi:hypothetical protein
MNPSMGQRGLRAVEYDMLGKSYWLVWIGEKDNKNGYVWRCLTLPPGLDAQTVASMQNPS